MSVEDKKDKQKQSLGSRIARRALAALLGFALFIVLVVGCAFLWLSSTHADRVIGEIAVDELEKRGLYLKYGELSGPLPFNLHLKDVELADAQGAFLYLKEARVSVSAGALFRRTVHISEIHLEEPELLRLPVLPESPQPEIEESGGFSLDLPVSVRLDAFTVKGGRIPSGLVGLAGEAPLALDLDLNAELVKGQLAAEMTTGLTIPLPAQAGAVSEKVSGPLEITLRLYDFILDAPRPESAGLTGKIDTRARWGGHDESLAASVRGNISGAAAALDELSLKGLGLSLSASGGFNLAQGAFTAAAKVEGADNAAWQSMIAALGGLEPSFVRSVGNPLDIDVKTEGGNGVYSLDIKTLKAGVINGSGRVKLDLGRASPTVEDGGTALSAKEGPSAVDADIALAVKNIGALVPGGSEFSGPLNLQLVFKGRLEDATGSLRLASPLLQTPAGEIRELIAEADAHVSIPSSPVSGGRMHGEGSLAASAGSAPGGRAAFSADWGFDLPKDESQPGSVTLKGFEAEGFGVKSFGKLQARLGPALLRGEAAKPSANLTVDGFSAADLWPQGLGLDGEFRAVIENWKLLASLLGLDIDVRNAHADVTLAYSDNTQKIDLEAGVDAVNMPGGAGSDGISVRSVAAVAETSFSPGFPDIRLSVETGPGTAAGYDWSAITADIDGRGRTGDFLLEIQPGRSSGRAGGQGVKITTREAVKRREDRAKKRAEAAAGQKTADGGAGKELTPRGKRPELLAVNGGYDLSSMLVRLDGMSAREPRLGIGAELRNPVTISLKNGVKVEDLGLDFQPGGQLDASFTFGGRRLELDAAIAALPLSMVNTLAGTTLPDGRIDGKAAVKTAGGFPQGAVAVELRLGSQPETQPGSQSGSQPGAQTGRQEAAGGEKPSPSGSSSRLVTADSYVLGAPGAPDARFEASLTRSSGRLWLDGLARFGVLENTQNSSDSPTSPGEAPVTFRVPMRLDASGIPQPDRDGPLQAAVKWTGEAAPLWALLPMPDRDFSGTAAVDISVTGSINKPQASGAAYLAGGRFDDRELGVMLTDIALEARAANLETFKLLLSASDGKAGKVNIEGDLNLGATPEINARGQINHLAPLHRDDLDIILTGILSIKGPLASMAVSADMLVERGQVTLLSSLGGGSVPTLEISGVEDPFVERQPGPMLDVHVSVPHRFYIRGRGIDSEWQGDLKVTGYASEPTLTGSLKPIRGYFELLSKPFQFTGGEIVFLGGTRINPGIGLELTYQSADLTAIVKAGGSMEKPELTLESKPPLPSDEVLAHVLFGKNISELSRFEALQLANSMRELAGIGDGGLDVLGNMRKATGLDVLRLGSTADDQENRQASGLTGASNVPGQAKGGEEADDATTIEAGKYINDSIYVGVEQGATSESTSVRVEIELFPNVTLQGKTSTESSSAGIGWKKDY